MAVALSGAAAIAAPSAHGVGDGPCAPSAGVTVVVERAGVKTISCDESGSKYALGNFSAVGHSIQADGKGFICRIDDFPGPDTSCTDYDSYWSLWDADGAGAPWHYSDYGARSLKITKGGWVAFKFQTTNDRVAPSMKPWAGTLATPSTAPTASNPTATATSKPTSKTSSKPSTKPTSKTSSTSAPTPAAPAASSARPTATDPSATPTAVTPTAESPRDATPGPANAAPPSAPDDETPTSAAPRREGGSPMLLFAGLAILAALGGGALVISRRKRS